MKVNVKYTVKDWMLDKLQVKINNYSTSGIFESYQVVRETEKAMLVGMEYCNSITENIYEVWIPKSAVLTLEERNKQWHDQAMKEEEARIKGLAYNTLLKETCINNGVKLANRDYTNKYLINKLNENGIEVPAK